MAKYYDADNNEITLEDLQYGDTFYGEDGSEYVAVTQEEAEQLAREAEEHANTARTDAGDDDGAAGAVDDDRELATVGKRAPSLGQTLLTELSKAVTEDDRAQVFARALDSFSKRETNLIARAETAERIAKGLLDRVEHDEYVTLAKSYDGVPAETDELADILKRATPHLDRKQLGTLDRILKSAGEARLLGELGHTGLGVPSDVMQQVEAVAEDVVSKADLTREQAIVAIFESDPGAYDAYESERR